MSKVFVFDSAICNGCYCCQVACKDEHCGNDWMPYAKPQPESGQFWFKLNEIERGSGAKIKVVYYPTLCMHCDNAPCIEVCPDEAINKRADGLVIIDPSKCSGCKMCLEACPYNSIYYNYSLQLAQKCTGCAHLLDRGWPISEPRCSNDCITGALKFGNESDFSSEMAEAEVMKPEEGASPRVYYKNFPKRFIAGTVYDPVADEVVIGANCTLSGDSNNTTTTDEFGDFWFEGLPVGTFSLTIQSGGKTKTIPDIKTDKDVGLEDIALG